MGDILTVEHWGEYGNFLTLMKGDKAVCDLDSHASVECCELIKE
ncbi:hypothetical protein [Clostridium tagluense]|uniref:Uncharacterized protein n=1 Tax=Clostridium tagluense TaxID=360422 RepID=A0A401UTQ7_9CLOT|nr:hypothetical protein [Clostridium tagluense]GCD12901.1 hypothetical protein Ctaglu_45240 [Clostridium tagluense]